MFQKKISITKRSPKKRGKKPVAKEEMDVENLPDDQLAAKLRELGVDVGPILGECAFCVRNVGFTSPVLYILMECRNQNRTAGASLRIRFHLTHQASDFIKSLAQMKFHLPGKYFVKTYIHLFLLFKEVRFI